MYIVIFKVSLVIYTPFHYNLSSFLFKTLEYSSIFPNSHRISFSLIFHSLYTLRVYFLLLCCTLYSKPFSRPTVLAVLISRLHKQLSARPRRVEKKGIEQAGSWRSWSCCAGIDRAMWLVRHWNCVKQFSLSQWALRFFRHFHLPRIFINDTRSW